MSRFLCQLAFVIVVAVGLPLQANAYSYAAAGKEPLIVGREPLLSAVAKGDWQGAAKAYQAMKPDLAYLDQNEDNGIVSTFDAALAARDADAVRHALMRAYADEIERRLAGARDNIEDYQTAKILVVKAQQFYEAMAGDLKPETRTTVEDGLKRALDAIGNPGIFGVGRKAADPQAFAKAHADVQAALADLHSEK
jgi:hypothetical protein